MTTQNPGYLGQVVRERRDALKLNKQAVHKAVGLNPLTLSKIENGEANRLRDDTLARLDKVLQWKEGSASDAYTKQLPPIDIAHAPQKIPRVLYVPFPPDLIQLTVRLSEEVARLAGGDERLASVVNDMNTVADRVLRAWTIADIERQRFDGTLSAATIEMLLGHYLRRTPDAPTDADQDELMYLRWLLGRLPESQSEHAERYAQRWAQAEQMLAAPRPINE